MPLFYYTNNTGKRERIFPLHFSDLTGFIIAETEKAKQLRIHQDCVETVNTEEEISVARRRYLEENYSVLINNKKTDK